MPLAMGRKPITLRGLVVPVNWDDQGTVSDIAISTFSEQEYLVSKEGRGKELVDFLRMEVEVEGILKEYRNWRMVTVKRYRLRR